MDHKMNLIAFDPTSLQTPHIDHHEIFVKQVQSNIGMEESDSFLKLLNVLLLQDVRRCFVERGISQY
jgi:hypothetical protein